jgi:hypothetical protein
MSQKKRTEGVVYMGGPDAHFAFDAMGNPVAHPDYANCDCCQFCALHTGEQRPTQDQSGDTGK